VESISFAPAQGIPAPVSLSLAAANHAVRAWPIGAFAKPMEGSNLLGSVTFQVPAGALDGQSYTVRLLAVDGASDATNAVALESASGIAWVKVPAPVQEHIVSDEWRSNFFGSLSAPQADSEVDPDGDGIPNWQEYLAGTNPTNAASCLQFSRAETLSDKVVFQWNAIPGRVYIVERSVSLTGASWVPVQTNCSVSAETTSISESILTQSPCFYRIRLQQP
jgi:hypothetical protein